MTDKLNASFPYPPYDIQQQFMINVVDTLEQKQIGLFESPTGTGKTLSIICSTLYWLEVERERKQQQKAAEASLQGNTDDVQLPDWLAASSTALPTPPTDGQKAVHKHPKQRLKRQVKAPILDEEGNDLSTFLPDGADNAASPGTKRAAPDLAAYSSGSSSEDDTTADDNLEPGADAAGAADRRQPQIIFCSRTHSQLSQFVGELHRTRFTDSILLVAVASRKALCVNDEVRKLSDLSQVNERCLELQRNRSTSSSSSKRKASSGSAAHSGSTGGATGGTARSNVVGLSGAPKPRRQRSSGRKAAGCPYLSLEGGAAAWEDFKDMVLAAPMDVEELATLGRRMKTCPYYGSRQAVPSADVVLAPYSAVLMPDARESLGIELQDSVLVFDEAHNLLDAINSAHSTAVTAWQLLSVQRSVTAYYQRFKGLLNPTNTQNLQRLLHIASALHGCLHPQAQQAAQQQGSSSSSSGRVMTVNDLLFDLALDNINMFELARWVKDNKMAFKVSGYTAAAVAKAGGSIQLQQHDNSSCPQAAGPAGEHSSMPQEQDQQQSLGQLSGKDGVSAIHSFVSFLLSLTHADADGRIIIEPAAAGGPTPGPAQASRGPLAPPAGSSSRSDQALRGGQLRYVLLNAARHFGKLLSSARSVLLVSGTLAPIEGLQAQLFPDIAPERVRHFECGHVVPAEQLLTVVLGRGPSGKALNLKHEARSEQSVMSELGQLLLNLCNVVPEGLVVFVPSFGYLEQLTTHWRSSGLWDRLTTRKSVFSEPRASTQVEAVLAAYAAAICGSSTASDSTPEQAGTAATGGAAPVSSGGSSSRPASSGALMLCVIGGKLSEGINFGDGLGRCVVVVGLPFPNRTDVELQARMQYLDRLAAQAAATAAGTAPHGSATAGRQGVQPQQPGKQQESQQQQQQQQHTAQAQQVPPSEGQSVHRSAFQVINQPGQRPPVTVADTGAASTAGPKLAAAPQHPSPPAGAAVATPPDQQAHNQPLAAAGAAAGADQQAHNQPLPDQQAHNQPLAAVVTSAVAVPVAPSATGGEPGNAVHSHKPAASSISSMITGRDYYEDLCFKAVNQCVGRVVRHKGDYAAVVLLDARWVVGPTEWAALSSSTGSSTSRRKVPVQKLPGWLQRSYVPTSGDFGPALQQLAAFFKRQKQLCAP